MKAEDYKKQIINDRINKDKFFKHHFQSPIQVKERENFIKLNYFEPDLNYRFEVELRIFDNKESIKIEDTGGNLRDFIKWGNFTFEVENRSCVLYAYKNEEEKIRLFIPFKDATSGKETYGAGRYLELNETKDKIVSKWILDFNLATNPWCAYSPNYVCPLIPFENILKVKILAGEKSYK